MKGRRLRMFKNRVLRKRFGPKRDEVTADWILHYEQFHDLYCSPHIRVIKSTKMRWAGHVARMWEDRKGYWILVLKPEGKRPLGSHRRRWEDNIKMDLKQI
jgi:hypothetical protein